ncbi:MAG: hypothetical protein MJ187_01190 [Alphaproteobacteria bacterium]|nr:hypothetical protein [Alphaproteobacteria bacterium]
MITESLKEARDIADTYLKCSKTLNWHDKISFKISKYNLEQAIRLIQYIKSLNQKNK